MNPASYTKFLTGPTGDALGLEHRRPAAVIYTHSLLEGSNTFIKSHAEALSKYIAIYAGAHRAEGISLPPDRSYVLNEGTPVGFLREALFRKWGWAHYYVKKLAPRSPSIVHAHFGTSAPAGMAIANALGIPLLVTFHGADATVDTTRARLSHRERELVHKKHQLIERVGGFIAVSNHIRNCLLNQGYPEKKIIVHHNGIDLDYFQSTNRNQREPFIVFVGRFVEKKGVEYLIEAAAILRAAGMSFELVMIGSGPLEPQLREKAASSDIRCHFTGFLSSAEVRKWLEKAAIVAVPSVTAANGDSEGLPTILLEAQAMETPVVATRHSGIPEGVVEGATAELVDERDSQGLALALRSFLLSPSKARKFGEEGRRFIAENFNLHTQVRALEDIYDEIAHRYLSDPPNQAHP